MEYERKYKEALEWMQSLYDGLHGATKEDAEHYFPELKENKSERVRKGLIKSVSSLLNNTVLYHTNITREEAIAWLEKQEEPKDKGEISDGYHTFNELYEYRKLYNAAFFNLLPKELVHKSKKHHDGEECFGGGWFIVMANLPTGQISNHYELKDWDLFQIPEKEVADEWDGHTPQDAADRLHKYLLEKQGKENNTYIINNTPNCGISVYNEELKESEDERIRKAIIEGLRAMKSNFYTISSIKIDDAITWLEKQCENKPTNKVEPKFHEGEWITNGDYTWEVTDIAELDYVLRSQDGNIVDDTISHVDEHFHLWTIQEAKDGDVLVHNGCPFIFMGIKDGIVQALEENLYGGTNPVNFGEPKIDKDYQPATKEQRDLLFAKMNEAGYKWDADKKKIEKIEPKKLDTDKVIGWLKNTIKERVENYGVYKETRLTLPYNSTKDLINDFKEDFGLC